MINTRVARQLGLCSALAVSVLGVVYLLLLIGYFATEGFVFPPSQTVQLVGGIVTFLTVPGLIVLFSAIQHVRDWDAPVLASLGVTLITLFAAAVSINRFVQLTVIRQAGTGPISGDLARFLPYDTGSVMFALEMLGWGFFSSLAALAIAPLFYGSRLNTTIRWLLVSYALFSLLGAIGYATESAISSAAFVAWGPILLALSVALAVFFHRER
ncbi:MAG: hypothetical protein ACYCYF_09600 [Anaerolineae bacterium]